AGIGRFRIKQYLKQVPGVSEVGVRTGTTINSTHHPYLGGRLYNLAAPWQGGFQANRPLLQVETSQVNTRALRPPQYTDQMAQSSSDLQLHSGPSPEAGTQG